ncbi:restriction endonuclease [Microbacteriaceae bacterium 4G12]
MKRNVWLVRPLPNGTNHMKDFLDEEFIAVGYPLGKDLSQYDYSQIRYMLQKKGWEEGIGNVNNLVHIMNIGDLVVVPDDNKKDVYFGEITSDYVYVKDLDENLEGSGYPHQRKVRWFFDKKPLLRSELPEDLKGSMRYPGTIADMTKHYEIINNILNGRGIVKTDSSLEEKALEVVIELLDSEDPLLRLRAAEIILKR